MHSWSNVSPKASYVELGQSNCWMLQARSSNCASQTHQRHLSEDETCSLEETLTEIGQHFLTFTSPAQDTHMFQNLVTLTCLCVMASCSAKPLDTDRKTRFRSTPVLSEKVAPHSTLTFAIDIDLCELQAKHASTPRKNNHAEVKSKPIILYKSRICHSVSSGGIQREFWSVGSASDCGSSLTQAAGHSTLACLTLSQRGGGGGGGWKRVGGELETSFEEDATQITISSIELV
ncbi:hypothetical protein RRG08_028965 [Elysia crispata]|uniref:Uncharacterized protein n=1 Tax=Elysia crispata TaxID=231223 RepID=A0AAE1AS95_9GAST|nr:hypothetical protein RRG08_028965 [Elysia crispata]